MITFRNQTSGTSFSVRPTVESIRKHRLLEVDGIVEISRDATYYKLSDGNGDAVWKCGVEFWEICDFTKPIQWVRQQRSLHNSYGKEAVTFEEAVLAIEYRGFRNIPNTAELHRNEDACWAKADGHSGLDSGIVVDTSGPVRVSGGVAHDMEVVNSSGKVVAAMKAGAPTIHRESAGHLVVSDGAPKYYVLVIDMPKPQVYALYRKFNGQMDFYDWVQKDWRVYRNYDLEPRAQWVELLQYHAMKCINGDPIETWYPPLIKPMSRMKIHKPTAMPDEPVKPKPNAVEQLYEDQLSHYRREREKGEKAAKEREKRLTAWLTDIAITAAGTDSDNRMSGRRKKCVESMREQVESLIWCSICIDAMVRNLDCCGWPNERDGCREALVDLLQTLNDWDERVNWTGKAKKKRK